MKKQAFTLIELVVVMMIMAILLSVVFISLKEYRMSARDAKRHTDISNLLSVMYLKNSTSWISYPSFLTGTTNHHLTINWEEKEAIQWIADFNLLWENSRNYIDPLFWINYEFAAIKSSTNFEWKDIWYNFIEWRYYSEKNEEAVILWNYSPYLEKDSPNLFTWSIGMWWDSNWGWISVPIKKNYECEWLPPSNAIWTYSGDVNQVVVQTSNDWGYTWSPNVLDLQPVQNVEKTDIKCYYRCTYWYTGRNCDIPPYSPPPWLVQYPDTVYEENWFAWKDIVITNWTKTIIIMDRNLGATTDDVSLCNPYDCPQSISGYFYQWWNNKPRPSEWPLRYTQDYVTNASAYWPNNYFYDTSDKPRIYYTSNDWAQPKNDNLWWNSTNTNIARRWPCPTGYHVPSYDEWTALLDLWFNNAPKLWWVTPAWTAIWGWTYTYYKTPTLPTDLIYALKLPATWSRNPASSNVTYSSNSSPYWSSSVFTISPTYSMSIWITANLWIMSSDYRSNMYPIRCFKN